LKKLVEFNIHSLKEFAAIGMLSEMVVVLRRRRDRCYKKLAR
jgi:hypothetical protein